MSKKVLFIIGAGASWDCATPKVANIAQDSYRPPLTNDLFSPKSGAYDSFREAVPSLSGLFGMINQAMQKPESNLEEYIRQIRLTHISKEQDHQLRWYLAAITSRMTGGYIRDSSNYDMLLAHIFASDVEAAFVSFNYDGLLELAISKIKKTNYNELKDHLLSPMVFKPHGSFGWFHDKTGNLQTNGLHFVFHPEMVSYDCAVMTPEEGKDSFVYPNDHHDALIEFVGSVDQIVTIGWRGNDEEFFRQVISNLNGKDIILTAVAGKEQTENVIYRKFGKYCNVRKCNYREILGLPEGHYGGFSKFLEMDHVSFADFFRIT